MRQRCEIRGTDKQSLSAEKVRADAQSRMGADQSATSERLMIFF